MSLAARITAVAAGAVGAAAVGVATATAVRSRRRRHAEEDRRLLGEEVALGSLRSSPHTVFTRDGVPLHVEIDEIDPDPGADPFPGADRPPVTLVFVHGYTLSLDCWHFQRAAYRGLLRSVYYDQRSHGRSGRSPTPPGIDTLAEDLEHVLDAVVPEGPVVLISHSMGGMTVVGLAERRPELFAPLAEGGRVVGTALISTTAGGLDPSKILLPKIPVRFAGTLTHGAVRTLARGHRAVDGVRRIGAAVARSVTHAFAFGGPVPPAYDAFVAGMIAETPFAVVAEFFPAFRDLDKFDHVETLGRVPTTVIAGTADKLVSIGHARKLHARIPGSTLVECEGAGHLVIMERHGQVNAALDQLLAAASTERA